MMITTVNAERVLNGPLDGPVPSQSLPQSVDLAPTVASEPIVRLALKGLHVQIVADVQTDRVDPTAAPVRPLPQ